MRGLAFPDHAKNVPFFQLARTCSVARTGCCFRIGRPMNLRVVTLSPGCRHYLLVRVRERLSKDGAPDHDDKVAITHPFIERSFSRRSSDDQRCELLCQRRADRFQLSDFFDDDS